MRLGVLELTLIVVLVLLVVGPKQLPKLTDAISSSVKSFKKEMKDEDEKTITPPEVEESAQEVVTAQTQQ